MRLYHPRTSHTLVMAGGRIAPSAGEVHRRANRAGPVAGWAWRDARLVLQLGRQQKAASVVLRRNGEAHFHFPTQQLSASSIEKVVGQQRGAQTQQQKQRANRAEPKQQPTTDAPMERESLSNKQHKSAARLQKFNLEMAAILELKLRHFVLRALKRARHDRVWRVAGPALAARSANPVSPSPLKCRGEGKAAGDKDSTGTKRASRSSPTIMGSPSASSPPSKTRSRTGASTTLIPVGNGPGSGTSLMCTD